MYSMYKPLKGQGPAPISVTAGVVRAQEAPDISRLVVLEVDQVVMVGHHMVSEMNPVRLVGM